MRPFCSSVRRGGCVFGCHDCRGAPREHFASLALNTAYVLERHDGPAGGVAIGREPFVAALAEPPDFFTFTVFHSGERRQWRMSAGWLLVTLIRMSFGAMQLGDGGDGAHADADALVIGQRDDAREAAMVLLA